MITVSDWLIVGLCAGTVSIVRESREENALYELREMVARDVDAVAVLNPSTRAASCDLFPADPLEPPGDNDGVTVFVAWQPSPILGLHLDRHDVQSCRCSSPVARAILSRPGCQDDGIAAFCFHLLEEIAQGLLVVGSLSVHQVGRRSAQPTNETPVDGRCTLVMAHRGPPRHLRAALAHAAAIRGVEGRTLVGLDIDEADMGSHEAVTSDHSGVEFFRVSPSPAGPYVVRRKLIEGVGDPLIIFHDSDDLSCSDRFEKLAPSLAADSVGLVGSHELRLDELSRRVIAVRYPLDVNGALGIGPSLAQLHPSTIVKRDVYERVGGFSTHVIFSADTQFLLRAFFHTRVRNVDEFLYIRRKHPGALTVRPDTGNGTPARVRTEAPWWADFARVKSGSRKLEESSLRQFDSSTAYRFERVFQQGGTNLPGPSKDAGSEGTAVCESVNECAPLGGGNIAFSIGREAPDVLVIIPSHGHFEYVKKAVRSLHGGAVNHAKPARQYVIVDDASAEWESVDWSTWPNPNCWKVHFGDHGGLTRSWNVGLRLAAEISAKYTVCTNSDVLFSPNWFDALVSALEGGFDLVGPVTNAPGHAPWQNVLPFCHPDQLVCDDQREQMGAVVAALGRHAVGPIEAPINGFFMMAKTETWWRGAFSDQAVFDPAYPLVRNEVELQQRWVRQGRRVGFCPQSYIFHYRSVSRPEGLKGKSGRGAYRPTN